MPIDIKGLEKDELRDYFVSINEAPFRANQLFRWLYIHLVEEVDLVKEFKKELRQKLKGHDLIINPLKVADHIIAPDKSTEKYAFILDDGQIIESVLMCYEGRYTVCISTQAGCQMGCSFCASARSGWARNLKTSEIVDQVVQVTRFAKTSGNRVSNIVFMGIGEPLLNYDNVIKAIKIINHPDGLSIGMRHISISTCGITDKILELSDYKYPLRLAVSLHAPSDELRSQIMPINKKYPLKGLINACKIYQSKTQRRITFEYSLIDGFNDSIECANLLSKILSGIHCLVNLIPFNQIEECNLKASANKNAKKFMEFLEEKGIKTIIREKRGNSIDGACGQLRLNRSTKM